MLELIIIIGDRMSKTELKKVVSEKSTRLASTKQKHKTDDSKQFYFSSLDGLRFFAFIWVFVGHLQRPIPGIGTWQKTNWIGVDLFFVLSAFLITSLFLIEFKENNKLSFKKFILRRSLRILPLYFVVAITGLFIFPQSGFEIGPVSGERYEELLSLTPYILSLTSNIVLPYSGVSIGGVLGPLWSICVEFQFYIIYGSIFCYIYNNNINKKVLPLLAIILFLATILFRTYLYYSNAQQYIYSNLFTLF